MEIIGNLEESFLISATKAEICAILKSAMGVVPDKIKIGQKIPAIDYATTIVKIKSLYENYDYKQLVSQVSKFNDSFNELRDVVDNAVKIDI